MSNYLLVVPVFVAIQLAGVILADGIIPQQSQSFSPNRSRDASGKEIINNNTNDLSYSKKTSTENIAIGNTNNNNYNIQKSDYTPTQVTQVVLNVPKPKKLRISRPPTEEEFEIKRKILSVYDNARQEARVVNSINFDHLGRILQALNPKYIATERVRRVAFGNPNDPTTIFSIPDIKPQPLSTISLKVSNNSNESLLNQLTALNKQFRSQVYWDLQFVNLLANTNDQQLNGQQLAFKKLLMCLTQPDFCPQPEENNLLVRQEELENAYQQQQYLPLQQTGGEMAMAASEINQQAVYIPPPAQFQQQQQQQLMNNNQMYQLEQYKQPQTTSSRPSYFQQSPQDMMYMQQQTPNQAPILIRNSNNNQQGSRHNRFKNNRFSRSNWSFRQ